MRKYGSLEFWLDQWGTLPPPLQSDLMDKTIIVTGANTGIGLETAKLFARQRPKKLIVACRSGAKGQAALACK